MQTGEYIERFRYRLAALWCRGVLWTERMQVASLEAVAQKKIIVDGEQPTMQGRVYGKIIIGQLDGGDSSG